MEAHDHGAGQDGVVAVAIDPVDAARALARAAGWDGKSIMWEVPLASRRAWAKAASHASLAAWLRATGARNYRRYYIFADSCALAVNLASDGTAGWRLCEAPGTGDQPACCSSCGTNLINKDHWVCSCCGLATCGNCAMFTRLVKDQGQGDEFIVCARCRSGEECGPPKEWGDSDG